MTPEELNLILNKLKTLDPSDLSLLSKGLESLSANKSASYLYQEKAPASPLPDLPSLSIPSELTIPHAEWLFIEFAKEVFKPLNMQDHYQSFDEEEGLKSSTEIIVESKYSNNSDTPGQYPRIVVDVPNLQTGTFAVGEKADQRTTISEIVGGRQINRDDRAAQLSYTVNYLVLSPNRNETNTLANILLSTIAVNRSSIRELAQLFDISYPVMESGQKVREKADLYMASVSMACKKMMGWSNINMEQVYRNIIYRVKAMSNDPQNPAVIQMISQIHGKVNPEIEQFIKKLLQLD